MAVPTSTLWKRGDHTEGKHVVLENYLQAWFPILGMGNRNGRILFIDGFAGPGQYEGGEEGSPVVAMRTLAEHAAGSRIEAEVVFHFIEEDPDRARHLQGLVDRWQPRLPATSKVYVQKGRFDASMEDVFAFLDEQGERMAPALVMIDPFGVKGMPMGLIERILANPKCEVYVSFMWESMKRFVATPEFTAHLDDLFATAEWRSARKLVGEERRKCLYDLYRRQLKKAGAKQVIDFHLYARKILKYSIFFATGHTKGSDRMKKAIWKVTPSGDFAFRGGMRDQLVMLELEPGFQPLRDALQRRFVGQGWVSVDDVLEFVRSDETAYHDAQVKKPVLKPMEEDGLLQVRGPGSRRKGTFPDGCQVRFLSRQVRQGDEEPQRDFLAGM